MHRQTQQYTRRTLTSNSRFGLHMLITCMQRTMVKPAARNSPEEPRELFLHKIINKFIDREKQIFSRMLHSSYHHSHATHYICKTCPSTGGFRANILRRLRVHEVPFLRRSDESIPGRWYSNVCVPITRELRPLISPADMPDPFPKDSYGVYSPSS
jgi:hypothetical protein